MSDKKKKDWKRYCAPGCETGSVITDEKLTLHKFPKDEETRILWTSKVPRLNWTVMNNLRICEKHFNKESFKVSREDKKNARRARRKGSDLVRKVLKQNAVPTIWPNCPVHLSKYAPTPHTSKNSSDLRTAEVIDEMHGDKNINTESNVCLHLMIWIIRSILKTSPS